MNPPPRILLFTGDGKGKTTAALGIALRALGHNLPTLIVQFIKCDDSTGEYSVFRRFPCVEIRQSGLGFLPPPSSSKFAAHQQAAHQALDAASRALVEGKYRVVILDEICVAVAKNLVDEEDVIRAIKRAPHGAIVVLTGREASQKLIDLADTVTEMRCLKHAYRQGRQAQEGVEF
ncbi:MAG: cob(I)yrinic acid a,c-diamide adenosyltransferase [Kiritimatiellia bacterium]|jgi:cob(I)alamin adenosyltransferase